MLSSADSLELEPVTLNDGTHIIIRPIHPDDAGDLQSAFMRLSTESIYLRFLSYKKELSDGEARRLANVDYNKQMAFVATYEQSGQDIVVGVSRYAMLDTGHPDTAEAAVVVDDKFQGRGIGRRLLWRLVNYARARGICFLRGNLQIGNDRMLTLVKRSGLPHETCYVDGIWEVTIDLRLPDYAP